MLSRTLAVRGLLVVGLGLAAFGCGQIPRPNYLRQDLATKQNADTGIWDLEPKPAPEDEPPAAPKRTAPPRNAGEYR